MIKILHLTFDYAEETVGVTSVAVAKLIKIASEFSINKVISFDRQLNPRQETIKIISDTNVNFKIFGLPLGLFAYSNMKRTYKKILKYQGKINTNINDYDIIHAHKLTFEGFIGYWIAKKFNKKLFISVRMSDFYFIKYRKDLKNFCREILTEAEKVFYISPYMKTNLKNIFGDKFYDEILLNKLVYLPNFIDNVHSFIPPPIIEENKFVSIFWMRKKYIKLKNLSGLLKAIKLLNRRDIQLEIIGDGECLNTFKKWVDKLNLNEQVKFLGFIDHKDVPEYLRFSKAFLLPSFSETFGLVYAESLLCGIPIMYSKNTGFDGVFENVGVAVDPHSISSIADGIKDLIDNNEFYRANIKRLHESGAFKIFAPENMRKIYQESISDS